MNGEATCEAASSFKEEMIFISQTSEMDMGVFSSRCSLPACRTTMEILAWHLTRTDILLSFIIHFTNGVDDLLIVQMMVVSEPDFGSN